MPSSTRNIASGEVAYLTLRAFLEAHPRDRWLMLAGIYGGASRSSAELLAEAQEVVLMWTPEPASCDLRELAVVEDRYGLVLVPAGTRVGGEPLLSDMPVMLRDTRP